MENCEKAIKKHAFELGFDLVGITDASPLSSDHIKYLKRWLADGNAAGMGYMHRNFDKRVNPALLLEGAKSIICIGLNYKPAETMGADSDVTVGRIASYACHIDYHEVIKEKLRSLADFIKENIASDCKYKVCVDSAPLAERAFAARAGIGFIAKNHMLTHPVFGQQLFLGELITNLQLQSDQPLANECAGCDKCINACPSGALSHDGTFDARRCISYLTIEHKEVIPQGLTEIIRGRIFGCDECVLACPRQKDSPVGSDRALKFHKELQSLDLRQVIEMDEGQFKKRFAGTPLCRLGVERLKRNAVICLQNSVIVCD